jgi:hypothetical protein
MWSRRIWAILLSLPNKKDFCPSRNTGAEIRGHLITQLSCVFEGGDAPALGRDFAIESFGEFEGNLAVDYRGEITQGRMIDIYLAFRMLQNLAILFLFLQLFRPLFRAVLGFILVF